MSDLITVDRLVDAKRAPKGEFVWLTFSGTTNSVVQLPISQIIHTLGAALRAADGRVPADGQTIQVNALVPRRWSIGHQDNGDLLFCFELKDGGMLPLVMDKPSAKQFANAILTATT